MKTNTYSSFALLHILSVSFVLCTILISACQKPDDPITIPEEPDDEPIVYAVDIPDGKLPWPHHNPNMDQQAYEAHLRDIWVINNYGQYQCGDIEESCYFHDGLDIVLDNGTPIYAVDSGIVRSILGSGPYYYTLIIEDATHPGMGWAYTHVNDFKVTIGEFVPKGKQLASVLFQGLDHIHFSRVKEDTGFDDFSGFVNVYPTDHFIFFDRQNPVIEKPFFFFPNQSDTPLPHGEPTEVSGEIDIVVGMRDAGQYARSAENSYGDRLCVQKIAYRILRAGEEISTHQSFDFTKLEFRFSPNRDREVLTVFKFGKIFFPDGPPDFNNRYVSHYNLTNTDGEHVGEIDPTDQQLSWNTLARNASNEAIYPNGVYEIEVTAWDDNGNKKVESDFVLVNN